jgi:two-component system, OmpR family, KDP operon response regulator KdpE
VATQKELPIALVVESDPWARLVMRDLLTDAGYEVGEASNGSAALRVAVRQPPALVVLDLSLPEWPGLGVLAELKTTSATAQARVIAVSDQRALLACAGQQADAVLQKPFSAGDLLLLIRSRRTSPHQRTHRALRDRDDWYTAVARHP